MMRGLLLSAVFLFFSPLLVLAQGGNISEGYLFAAANEERLERGLRPLILDSSLQRAALLHAREMAARGTISHQFRGEFDLARRAGNQGAHFSLITENVAEAPTSSLIHVLWMQSEGHRHNLLDAQVDAVGISVVARNGELFAVEDFARTVLLLSLDEQEARVAEIIAARGLRVLTDPADARRACLLASESVDGKRPWFTMRYATADLARLPEELLDRLSSKRYGKAAIGACYPTTETSFSRYNVAVLLYP